MENRDSVDQKRAAVKRFLAEHATALAHQGSIVQSWRHYQGRRLGPYYRIACRDGRAQRSVYLGMDRELVNEVRRVLEELQRPSRDRRQFEQVRRAVGRQLAVQQAELDQELARANLYRKGWQILGWRRFEAVARRAL